MAKWTLLVKRPRGKPLPEIIPVLQQEPYKRPHTLEDALEALVLEPKQLAYVRRSTHAGTPLASQAPADLAAKLRLQRRENAKEAARAVLVESLQDSGEMQVCMLDEVSDGEEYDLVEIPGLDLGAYEYCLRLQSDDSSEEDSHDSEDSNREDYFTNDYPEEESSSEHFSESSEYSDVAYDDEY